MQRSGFSVPRGDNGRSTTQGYGTKRAHQQSLGRSVRERSRLEGGGGRCGISHHPTRSIVSCRALGRWATEIMVLERDAALAEAVMGEGKKCPEYLLSDQRGVMRRLHLEGAVVGPEVDRIGYAGASSLINLDSAPLAVYRNNSGVRERRGTGQPTISADSGPAMLNSRSAYFFQYPKKSGNLSRSRS